MSWSKRTTRQPKQGCLHLSWSKCDNHQANAALRHTYTYTHVLAPSFFSFSLGGACGDGGRRGNKARGLGGTYHWWCKQWKAGMQRRDPSSCGWCVQGREGEVRAFACRRCCPRRASSPPFLWVTAWAGGSIVGCWALLRAAGGGGKRGTRVTIRAKPCCFDDLVLGSVGRHPRQGQKKAMTASARLLDVPLPLARV